MLLMGQRVFLKRKQQPGRAAVLGASLVLSALLTAVSLRVPGNQWLAWISLLPLFHAMRSLRLPTAAMAGGLWGACLYLFCVVDSTGLFTPISPSFSSLVLLTAVPAVYVSFGALMSRAIGFNPLMLAIGWILVEVAFKPLGLHQGLLAGTQTESAQLHWLARLLGYVFVAFLVACANASLLVILSYARVRISQHRSFAELSDAQVCLPLQTLIFVQCFAYRRTYPRAPPI